MANKVTVEDLMQRKMTLIDDGLDSSKGPISTGTMFRESQGTVYLKGNNGITTPLYNDPKNQYVFADFYNALNDGTISPDYMDSSKIKRSLLKNGHSGVEFFHKDVSLGAMVFNVPDRKVIMGPVDKDGNINALKSMSYDIDQTIAVQYNLESEYKIQNHIYLSLKDGDIEYPETVDASLNATRCVSDKKNSNGFLSRLKMALNILFKK